MQRELTINISDETYNGLMDLVGKQNAGEFVEAILRPYILLACKSKTYKMLSPRLADSSQAERFKVEIVDN
jgi:hypothetical protein